MHLGVIYIDPVCLYESSADIWLVELAPLPDGSLAEREAPVELPSNRVTSLHIYGSVYFASSAVVEEAVPPSPRNAERAVVILQLRGQSDVGSPFIKVAERYAARLQEGGGKLLLAGVSERVLEQLRQTETTETIPEDDFLLSE